MILSLKKKMKKKKKLLNNQRKKKRNVHITLDIDDQIGEMLLKIKKIIKTETKIKTKIRSDPLLLRRKNLPKKIIVALKKTIYLKV